MFEELLNSVKTEAGRQIAGIADLSRSFTNFLGLREVLDLMKTPLKIF